MMTTLSYTEPGFFASVRIDRPAPDHRTYGGNLRTTYMALCADGRERRVYAMCYGNAASLYVRVGGVDTFLSIDAEAMCGGVR